MAINPNHIKYKTDSGAQVTVTSLKAHLQQSSTSLTAYNGKDIPVMSVNVQYHRKSIPLLFVVDKTQSLAIIELSLTKKFNLIFRAMFVIQKSQKKCFRRKEQYTECFEEKGTLPNTHHNTVFYITTIYTRK